MTDKEISVAQIRPTYTIYGTSYQCIYCYRKFTAKNWGKHDQGTCTEWSYIFKKENDQYLCKVCDEDFTKRDELLAHMLVHDGKVPKEYGFKQRILQIQATQAELKLKDKRAQSLRIMRERRQKAKEEAHEKVDEVKKVKHNMKQMKQ